MFYNTLNYDTTSESESRTKYLKTILEEVQPDLFMVCELKNEAASNYLFANAILPYKESFQKAPFKYSQSPATDLLQMVYYNESKLTLENTKIISTELRDINHYTFKINDENLNTPLRIEVYVTHLKASGGEENRQKRYSSAFSFVRELEDLPPSSFVLFAGDFNFYTSNEEGFLRLIDESNPIKIIDPINRLCPTFPNDGKDYFDDANYNSSYFWNNSSFADVHSQSTRTAQVNGDGAGGGMDDRFDFILISENFNQSSNLSFVPNSYKTIGNNGNCYNSYVSNTSCNGNFSQELRNALYYFSDHLPIVMEIETKIDPLSIEKNKVPIHFLTSNIVGNSLILKLNKNLENITIYNVLGKVLYQQNNIKTKELKIETSSYTKGIYYIKSENYQPLKFIKI